MPLLYQKLSRRNITFSHVCEVGVYLPETSNIIDFIKKGIRATLVEADPATVEKINAAFRQYNINVHPVAVWDHKGTLQLSKADASTFATALPDSPALQNDRYTISEQDIIEVPCTVFSEIDDGTIDLLSIDIEGSEWYVLKHLVSRPKVISVETHGKYYTNPFMEQISSWMSANSYVLWYKDGSDSVFIREHLFSISAADRRSTRLAELSVAWKKLKRSFRKGRR